MFSDPTPASAPRAGASPTISSANGRLSLGAVALSRPVLVKLVGDGLEIAGGETEGPIGSPPQAFTPRLWPLSDLHVHVPLTHSSQDALVTSKSEPRATLFIADKTLLADLLSLQPSLGAAAQRWRWAWPGLIAGGVFAGIVATLWSLNISPSSTLAHQLPDGLRTRFGSNVIKNMTGNLKTCASAEGQTALKLVVDKLTAGLPEAKSFRVSVIDWSVVNAFTAPGGQIVVARGLIDKAQSADEVAGVIAHELGHAIERHPEAGIIRVLGLSAAAEIVLGGSSATAGNVGLLFAQMSYSRDAEREADAHAFHLLKTAAISPKGIAAFFRRIDGQQSELKKAGSSPFATDIFSTHPASSDRAALAQSQPEYPAQPVLDEKQWASLQTICGPKPVTHPPAPPKPTAPLPGQTSATAQPAPTATLDKEQRIIAEATATLAANPNDETALRNRVRAYLKKRNFAAASPDVEALVKLKFADDEVMRMRGVTRLGLNDPTNALSDFSILVSHNPKDAFAVAERGRCYYALKRYDEAIADFRVAIGLRQDMVDQNNLGLALSGKKDFANAITAYTIALKGDPTYIGALVNRGWTHEQAGDKTAAIADYAAAATMALPPLDRYPLAPKSQEFARNKLKALGAAVPAKPH